MPAEFNSTEEQEEKDINNDFKQSKMPTNPLHLVTVGVQTDSGNNYQPYQVDNSSNIVKSIYFEVEKWFEQYKKYIYFVLIALLLSMFSYKMVRICFCCLCY